MSSMDVLVANSLFIDLTGSNMQCVFNPKMLKYTVKLKKAFKQMPLMPLNAFKQTHIITAESPVLECVIVYCLCRVSSMRATHCAW